MAKLDDRGFPTLRETGRVRRESSATSHGLRLSLSAHKSSLRAFRSVMEVDADGYLDDQDRGHKPVDRGAERWPPAGVVNEVTPLLPEVLEAMTGESDHEQPRRSGHCRSSKHHECPGDGALDGNDIRPAVRNREADVDGSNEA